MALDDLNAQVLSDLAKLNFGGKSWVLPRTSSEGHVYDVVIVGGGQSGLGAAFGLLRERIDNILVIDDSPVGFEGPWETYARMMTLRTPKQLTGIDQGIPSLTFRAWWEAQHGTASWEAIDKIPRGNWMEYLRWYRKVLSLPVQNNVKLEWIEPTANDFYRLHVSGVCVSPLLARKVVLATGIQGGGQWHTPDFIRDAIPRDRFAHTSEPIDFEKLSGKSIGILGGGASAFDNANHALSQGVAEVHVFVRRPELPRVNPIRQMEHSGLIEHYAALSDDEKYAAMAHFFKFNQPPTNDTFQRAASWSGFEVHTGAPWTNATYKNGKVHIVTPKGPFDFDFVILSTGLVSDPRLRPEFQAVVDEIALWQDVYRPPVSIQNPLLDAHPYLKSDFSFTPKSKDGVQKLYGLFAFNYSALLSLGLSASALSGIRYAIPKLVTGIGDQLFLDDRDKLVQAFLDYSDEEFTADRTTNRVMK